MVLPAGPSRTPRPAGRKARALRVARPRPSCAARRSGLTAPRGYPTARPLGTGPGRRRPRHSCRPGTPARPASPRSPRTSAARPAPSLPAENGSCRARRSSEALFVDAGDVACPLAVKLVEQALRGNLAAGDDLLERLEEPGLAVASLVQPRARDQAGPRDRQHLAREIEQGTAARDRRIEGETGHRATQRLAFFHRPAPDEVPRRIERGLVIEQSHPQGGQRADPVPRPAVGAAHLEEALEANLGERRR